MTALTSQLLTNYPYSRYADSRSIQRGRNYYKEDRVWDMQLIGENLAICAVEGDADEYTVEIEFDQKSGDLNFDCDCPYADGHFCKHMVAAGLALGEFLKNREADTVDDRVDDFVDLDNAFVGLGDIFAGLDDVMDKVSVPKRPVAPLPSPLDRRWKQQLDSALLYLPRSPQSGGTIQRYAAVLLMVKEQYYYEGSYSFAPYIIKAKAWTPLQGFSPDDAQAVNELLDANHEWPKYGEDLHSQTNPAGCLNLNPEAFTLLFLLQQYMRYFGGASFLATFFPMLAQLHIPVFLASRSDKTVEGRIQILPNPVDVEVTFTRENENLVLRAGLKGEALAPDAHKVEVVSRNPPWLLMDNRVFRLRDERAISILSYFPITIPERDADFFREQYLRRVAESLPIQSDLLHWRDVQADPIPRLYLRDDKDNVLRAELCYSYGEHEVPAAKAGELTSIEPIPDSWDMLRIYRQPEREQHFYQLLTDPVYRLKRSDNNLPYGTFELRSRVHPYDFLIHAIPLLTQAGFEIYGEEKLKLGKINRSTPTLRVNITSGIDWFDLQTSVAYGDQQISFHDVRKALKRGEHYIKLADGSIGQIPAEWLEKYKHLWNLASETAEGFRVNDIHLSLIDSLLENDATIQIPPDLQQRRERFRSFEHIEPQPLPEGLIGELRPYQKHGFDWLHFLREYKFGGVLADDMGLGKTVQVLALLLSLREQTQGESVSLLVVPKSLIANWQREGEKFTPDLTFLEYIGNLRNKDTAVFNDYDVVLTTYGTMLRDIEILRQYKFHYIILDESQAIKNPLAKSAKAARLLNAEHRLVMTGTPVENNTFDLWSQFAFLTPGLLGSIDYFKHEFATPIESGNDEPTAATLRKLVYPFILRRTKEQVAPELPPRTERILYTEMDAAQKKLYVKTRERYRAELLGLIESEGMQDARFKLFEGLLRLRQIAIHPALVDRTYRGEAPKFEVLLQTLGTLQAEHHKALIFSQFVETLKLVKNRMDAQGTKYVYLDGKTPNRQSRVDLFQDDPSIPFFLISLKAGGVGLNLTAADYVIHLDPWWNPAVEMQASDRSHRIGQDKPVFIYKIITRDTVEEKILKLQEKKRALVTSIIATEANFFKSLTQDDVKMLFT